MTKYYITEKELFLLAKFYDGSDLLIGRKELPEKINLPSIFLFEFLPKENNYIYILLKVLRKFGTPLEIKFNRETYERLENDTNDSKFSNIEIDKKRFLINEDIIGTLTSLEQLFCFSIDKKEYEKTIISLKEELGVYLKKNFSEELKIKTKNYLNFNESKEVLFNKIKEKGYIEKISNEFVLESDFNKNNEFLIFHTIFTMDWFLDYFLITKFFIEEKNIGGIRIKIREKFLIDYNKKYNLKKPKSNEKKSKKKTLIKVQKTDKDKYLITVNKKEKVFVGSNRSDGKMWCMLYEIAKNGIVSLENHQCGDGGEYLSFVKNINNPKKNSLKKFLENKGIFDNILEKDGNYAKSSKFFDIKDC